MKSLLTGILILGSSLAFAHEAPNDVAVDAAKDIATHAVEKAADIVEDAAVQPGEQAEDLPVEALAGVFDGVRVSGNHKR